MLPFWARRGVHWPYYTAFSVGAVNQGAKPLFPRTRTGSMFLLGAMVVAPGSLIGGFHERRRLIGRGAFSFGGFRH